MQRWKAWLLIGVMLSLTALLVWWGLTISVRADRVGGGRVDVTVQRRFLGLVPVSVETVADVIKADVFMFWGRTSGGGKQRRGSTVALDLTPRQGPVVRRRQFGPAFGTVPDAMANRLQQFLGDSSQQSLAMWWTPWLVNVAGLLFVLVVGSIVGEVVLRALGLLNPAPAPAPQDS